MRWKLDMPSDGDKRVIERFALFPRTLDDKYRVWLEKYYVKQKYHVYHTMSNSWETIETWSQSTQNKKTLDKIR